MLVQGAPYLEINKELKEIVETHPDKKLTYVSIRGIVKPLGNAIVSSKNPKVSGVVQLLSIKEHVVQRSTAGAWSDHERVIQEVHNVMPFALSSGSYEVEVIDPLGAEILDMDVISDVFKPSQPSVMDHIWGFLYGLRQRGIQETEKMLRKGSIITGIGELVSSKDGNILRLQPPSNGAPFYLTNMQITSLVRKLDDSRRNYRLLCILFGTIGIIITGLIVRRYWKGWRLKIEEQKLREQIAISRRERRKHMRDDEIPENQLCVVCRTNPREVYFHFIVIIF